MTKRQKLYICDKKKDLRIMMDTVWDWLMENYPTIFLIVFLCVVVGVIVWKIANFYHRYKKVEEKVDALPCNAHLEEINVLKSTASKIDSICEQLNEITKWIMKLDPTEIDSLAPKFSPRRMTKAGLSLYEISGAKAIVDANEDSFIEAIRSEEPQTPLDVEDRSYVVLASRMAEPIFNAIKNYIYYQPEKITLKGDDEKDITVTLSLSLLLRLMSIDLRDRYLTKYPMK